MTGPSVESQALLPAIQNKRGISYAGAWTKYGFHEDGFASGMRLACSEVFGAKPPFEIRPARRELGPAGMGEHVARAALSAVQMAIVRWRAGLALVQLVSWFCFSRARNDRRCSWAQACQRGDHAHQALLGFPRRQEEGSSERTAHARVFHLDGLGSFASMTV